MQDSKIFNCFGFNPNTALVQATYFPAWIPWFFSGKINRYGRNRMPKAKINKR
jgi:hypothetical protein